MVPPHPLRSSNETARPVSRPLLQKRLAQRSRKPPQRITKGPYFATLGPARIWTVRRGGGGSNLARPDHPTIPDFFNKNKTNQ